MKIFHHFSSLFIRKELQIKHVMIVKLLVHLKLILSSWMYFNIPLRNGVNIVQLNPPFLLNVTITVVITIMCSMVLLKKPGVLYDMISPVGYNKFLFQNAFEIPKRFSSFRGRGEDFRSTANHHMLLNFFL